jgi:hypothetical protein
MVTRTWAEVHDAHVRAQLAELGDDGQGLLVNLGKLWVAGAPLGRAWLYGWRDDGHMIQPKPAPGSQGPHNDQHSDYATLTVCVRTEAP